MKGGGKSDIPFFSVLNRITIQYIQHPYTDTDIIIIYMKKSVPWKRKKVQTLDSCFGLLVLGAAQSLPGTAELK